jgi:hypothetical protein
VTRLEEEDHEPVAVVRTLADFALALTLIVLMLVGTRPRPRAPPPRKQTPNEPA